MTKLVERIAQVERGLAEFKALHEPLRSGELAEAKPDDAKSWKWINAWLEADYGRAARCSGSPNMYVVSLWPVRESGGSGSVYSSGGNAAPIRTYSDALAHAAQWCELELSK